MRYLDPLAGLVAACLFAALAAQDSQKSADLHAGWDRILQRHVVGERVDYLGLAMHSSDKLDAYLEKLAAVDPAKLGKDDRLAFYINLYNASMVRAVADRYRAGWTPAADEFGVFKAPVVRLRGKATSLDHIENGIVRKEFDEPRIHVALVCGAVSCPPILDRAWRGKTLEATLEARMRKFLTDRSRNDIRPREVRLSKIFEWFKGDFEKGGGSLVDYMQMHGAKIVDGATISHIEYDWSLNIATPRDGEWAEVVGRDLTLRNGQSSHELHKGDVVRVVKRVDGRLAVVSLSGETGTVDAKAVRAHRVGG